MKIYTRKGDSGRTGIWGGKRLDKDSARIEAIGSVDECNAVIGLAIAQGVPEPVNEILGVVQNRLFVVGSELMAPDTDGPGASLPRLSGEDVTDLEAAIDRLEPELPELRNFILPSGSVPAAHLHVARAVCRRAERRVATLRHKGPVNPDVAAYLNRLADLLFVVARYVNHRAGAPEVPWAPRG
ncbi:cob(I)yrinic acid a,c-diamide adenosyltransferase [Actinomadura terrae]|uniref:cob(I)yrinic acid a,c-diamide adenosyltransferase n=1 Tax=Actinomadura terrae TaxID=604353 RepID=UPI001FA6B2DF|nr:cob(I)yrinic acid a,c-diamide adenosyltransferase [Actinomadura terrae]